MHGSYSTWRNDFLANKFIIDFILYINLQLIYEQSCYSYIII